MKAVDVYAGSDGAATRAYYARLEQFGAIGRIAMNLFRAQKCSARAKVYRGGVRGGGSFKRMAYERKEWSLAELVGVLEAWRQNGGMPEIAYGWKQDPGVLFDGEPSWVLYVDLPVGQVSFHAPARSLGPDYPGEWDRSHASEARILRFCDEIIARGNGSMELFG
jgi:hypothetical protein